MEDQAYHDRKHRGWDFEKEIVYPHEFLPEPFLLEPLRKEKNILKYTVLHTESSEAWGGQENRILQECIGLRRFGARVIVLCQPGSVLATRAASEGFEVRTCRMRKNYDLPAIYFICKLIKDETPDIVSTHSGRDSFLAGVAARISRRKPLIVRTRHLALPITSRITYSILPHRVVTVSEYVRQNLIERGIPSDKVITIPTGIDLRQFDPDKTAGDLRQELKLKPDIPLLGTVAIFRIQKGYHVMLDAVPSVLEKIPMARFVFVGDGPQMENIYRKVKDLGLSDKIFMLGLRRDVPNILKSVDLFVLPTLQEALGTAFLEAMAMGKPVIGTEVGGVGEVIRNGNNGYLVKPNNPQALAEAIIALLLNREKAALMGREGRRMVRENFNTEVMCSRMHDLYTSLIDRRS
jgi:glycosyltransferase involved in cell wall biosynthesis